MIYESQPRRSHHENLTTFANSMRESTWAHLRREAEAAGGLCLVRGISLGIDNC
jgi:hypothetical protein